MPKPSWTIATLAWIAGSSVIAQTVSVTNPVAAVQQIEQFLNRCPANDPAFSTIRGDFDIRLNGVTVTSFPCTEPYTGMAHSQFTPQTLLLQALRIAYYMDQGRSNYLPWTPLRLYDWMKSKVAGIDIITATSSSSCCENLGGKQYIFYGGAPRDDLNIAYSLTLDGVLANVALLAHESRHVDGFPHVSCCNIANGCDQNYDESNLSPYGIQYFLQRAWLGGNINLSLACLDQSGLPGAVGVISVSDANIYVSRFCGTKPAALPADAVVGGKCIPGAYPLISPGGIGSVANFQTTAVTLGGIIGVFGPNLSAGTDSASAVPLPPAIDDTSLSINGARAPLFYVSPTQINAQVPYETTSGLAQFTVTASGNLGFRRYAKVNASAPSFFITADGQAIAQNQDFSLNTPSNPAQAGSYVTVYFTGQGASSNQVPTGAAAPLSPLSRPNAGVNVTVGGIRGTVAFIGLTPTFVGLSQLNLQLSTDTPAGNDTITLTIGTSATSAKLAVTK
ncbi:MAG TPA: hypothetical protein VEU96_15645 [Bryobacteraceae bacterium]|nr:hypothetical protein [Bryobacteraceae bacterium]